MGQSAGVIASLALKTGVKHVHDVDTALLHAALLQGAQLMNERCDASVTPPGPPPPHAAAWTVEGAGTTSCNGVYRYDPHNHRDPGTAFYTKDSGHQLYRSGGVWRIAHGLAAPNFLWYTSTNTGGTSPPVSGWRTEPSYKGVAPLPRLANDSQTRY